MLSLKDICLSSHTFGKLISFSVWGKYLRLFSEYLSKYFYLSRLLEDKTFIEEDMSHRIMVRWTQKMSWLHVHVNILYIDINNNDGILEEHEYYMVWLETCVQWIF